MAELGIIGLIWIVGTCVRVYRQARFYQIEEYMNGRYLRWVFARRDRWLPTRPVAAWAAGIVAMLLLTEAPGTFMLTVIGVISALVAVWPPGEGEVKKGFRPTARAKRMLGAAFVQAPFDLALYVFLAHGIGLPAAIEVRYILLSCMGLFLFLTAPFILIGGNLLMTPVEA
ncbi:MAG: hypothetical protein JNJ61_26590, partial [Anaerolineae bacterium]|nr:hypothetical protein [Anaerolineae bacterium]